LETVSKAFHITFRRLAFVADFGTKNFNLKTKFDMENNTSTNHENGNAANRVLANRAFVTTEIVQKWPDGTEEVKYRRPYGSESAKELMQQVDERANKSGYFYRHVC